MISSTVCLTLKPLHLVLEEEPHKKFIVAKSPLESKFENSVCYIPPVSTSNLRKIKNLQNLQEQKAISISFKGEEKCKLSKDDDTLSNSATKNTNIEEAINDLESVNADEKSFKDENYIQREAEIKNNRQYLLNLKRINPDQINSIRDIKNIKLNKADYMDSMFKCGVKIKFNCRNKLFDYIKNGLNMPSNKVEIYKVEGKGEENCFYRCLSEFLYGRPDYYKELRKAVITFCKENIEELSEFKEKVEIKDGVEIDTKEYINKMDEDNTWCRDIEITATCFLFGMNTAIYNNSTEENNLDYTKSYFYDDSLRTPLMVLNNDKPEHFNVIFPKLEIIEFQRKTRLIPKDENEVPKPYRKKKKEEIEKMDEDSIADTAETAKCKSPISNCEVNPFPTYSHGNDGELYWNIFKFLDSGTDDGKRKWPDYILNIKDKRLRDLKKADFYRKVGIVKSSRRIKGKTENGDIIRTEIYSSKDRYIIEDDKLYLGRIEHSKEDPKKLISKKFMIPFKKDIRAILHKCHDEKNHQCLQDTFESIKDNNYFWTTMYADSIKYIKMCSVCNSKNK